MCVLCISFHNLLIFCAISIIGPVLLSVFYILIFVNFVYFVPSFIITNIIIVVINFDLERS